MRVAVAGFLHESNTFLPAPSTLEDFQTTSWTEGEGMRERWRGTHHELGGLLDGCEECGLEAVPLLATWAVPGGAIETEAFESIASRIVGLLREALPVGGVLLALHGATVSTGFPDADGEITRRVRALLGPGVPLMVTLDLHANISRAMVEHSDATVCYRSNPHLDQRERGLEAARLMARTLRGEVRPVQALETPPWLIPIDRQYTAEEPAGPLYHEAARAAAAPGMLSASVAMGFYYADVAEMGASFLAVADGDRALAAATARQLAARAWQRRREFRSRLLSVDEAARRAASAARTPVGLFDVGDNVGGGAPGDSVVLLEELLRQRVPDCLAVLCAPDAVRCCLAAGVRNQVNVTVGSLRLEGRVRTISDGLFDESQVRHGGWSRYDQGTTAVLEAGGGHTVVLTSRRMAPMSLEQVLSLGIAPQRKRAIVVKGVVAPRSAYEPICAEILLVDTPGVTAGDPARFTYHHRRRPLYPLESEAVYPPAESEA